MPQLSDSEAQYLLSQGATPQDLLALEKGPAPATPAPPTAGISSGASHTAGSQMSSTAQAPVQEAPQSRQASGGGLGGAVERAAGSDLGMLPFAGAIANKFEGKPAYSPGAAGAGEIAGDIGNTAGMIAGGLPAALKFLGVNAASQALGIPQALAKVGTAGENALDQAVGTNLPSKELGIEGLGTAANMAARLPGAAFDVASNALPALLSGKVAGVGEEQPTQEKIPVAQPLSQQESIAQDLQAHGYPITKSHLIPGDTTLKAATTNPLVNPEMTAYKAALNNASNADIGQAISHGGTEDTSTLGSQFQDSFAKALNQRSKNYGNMMDYVQSTNPAGELTGIGKYTKAGVAFRDKLFDDLKSQGLDLNAPGSREEGGALYKALVPGQPGLTMHDMPNAGMNPADVTAAIRFADLAAQKAKSSVDLDKLASNFSSTEGIFSSAGGPGANKGGFLKNVRGMTQDQIAKTLQERDEMMGLKGTPQASYPQWAAQKDKWAQYHDLVDEFGDQLAQPKTRQGGVEMYSAKKTAPEQIFNKIFQNGDSETINGMKGFLADHGQDPSIVEKMSKDYLTDIAQRAQDGGKDPVQAVQSVWAKMPQERKAALFSQDSIKEVNAALARVKAARAPLEVMGTKMSGESGTQARTALSSIKPKVSGPIGALARAATGKFGDALEANAARKAGLEAIAPAAPVVPTVPSSSMMQNLRRGLQSKLPMTPPISGGVPALIRAAMAAKALQGSQAQ